MTFTDVIDLVAATLDRPDLVQRARFTKGTQSARMRLLSNFDYTIWGRKYTAYAADNITMTTCAVQATNTFCFYVITTDQSAQFTITKGTETTTDTCLLPAVLPAGQKAVSAFKIRTTSPATFQCGVTDLGAANISYMFYDFDCGAVADFVRSAIRKLEREYNFRCMKIRTSVAISKDDYEIANPIPRYKQLISAYCVNSGGVRSQLEKTSISKALLMYPNATDSGVPRFIVDIAYGETSTTPDAVPTHTFMLRPKPDADYTLDIYAYQYSAQLDFARYNTNWWTDTVPEIVLLGALVNAEPYVMNDPRVTLWKSLYAEQVKRLIDSEIDEEFKGSSQEIMSEYAI